MHLKKYTAEVIGTFVLSLVVVLATNSNIAPFTPLLVGVVLCFAVYTIGSISGSHINPAITLGLLSVKKISPKDALFYIIAQFVGAILAFGLAGYYLSTPLSLMQAVDGLTFKIFIAEVLGTAIFGFGIASVVFERHHNAINGIVIGVSIFLGILFASFGGALGFLNPAVAFANGSLNIIYGLAPIVGSVIGFNLYKFLSR